MSSAICTYLVMTQMEVSPKSIATAQALARRISEHGGAALLVDYGKDGVIEDTVRVITTTSRPLFITVLVATITS